MPRTLAAAMLALALPAFAADGFFPQPVEHGPASLRILRCTPGQAMACTVHCPAPADGRMPAAAVCQVVACSCEDAPATKSAEISSSSALVTFNLRGLLGLPIPK